MLVTVFQRAELAKPDGKVSGLIVTVPPEVQGAPLPLEEELEDELLLEELEDEVVEVDVLVEPEELLEEELDEEFDAVMMHGLNSRIRSVLLLSFCPPKI